VLDERRKERVVQTVASRRWSLLDEACTFAGGAEWNARIKVNMVRLATVSKAFEPGESYAILNSVTGVDSQRRDRWSGRHASTVLRSSPNLW